MTQTSTGIKLSISSGIPATYDLSGYGALTYFEIGEVTNIPQFGAQFQTVTNQPLATGITEKRKGFVNYGDPVIDMALDNSNMGQQMMKSACDGIRKSQVHAFMLQYGNGEIRYWSGRVFSFQEAPGSANNMVGATSQIGITRAIIQIPRITLDLSFAENFYSLGGEPKNFSDIITFSRSTTSTYFDQNGVMQTAPIDTPCLAYDPSTLEPLGLQVFGAATNLLTYSEQFDNAAWAKTGSGGSSVSANATASPDSSATADKFIPSNSAGTHYLRYGFSYAASTTYTLSIFVKKAEESIIRPSIFGGTTVCEFNLDTGIFDSVSSGVSAKATSLTNGWFRLSLTATSAATPVDNIEIYSEDSSAGDGVSGTYIWGAQLETGSIATPYIKTEASQVTRAADIATVDDLSGWYNQSQGSVFVEAFTADGADHVGPLGLLELSSNLLDIRISDGGVFSVKTALTVASAENLDPAPYQRPVKVALNYGGIALLGVDGSTYAGTDTGPIPATALEIGRIDATPSFSIRGHIKTLNYYPSQLTENEMKLITL